MKRLTLLLTLSVSFISAGTMAYEVCGNSTDGFVLKCNDGHN